MIDVARHLGGFPVQGVAGQADDAEQARQALAGALLRPVEGRALGIGVDQHDALALPGPGSGEVQGEGGLAGAALLVEQGDDHGRLPVWRGRWQNDGADSGRGQKAGFASRTAAASSVGRTPMDS